MCHIIRCPSPIRKIELATLNFVTSRGRGRVIIEIWVTFLESLYSFIEISSRRNAFSILCRKCFINIATRRPARRHQTNRRTLLLFRADHQWDTHCFLHCSHNSTHVTRSELHSNDCKYSYFARKALIRQCGQQKTSYNRSVIQAPIIYFCLMNSEQI